MSGRTLKSSLSAVVMASASAKDPVFVGRSPALTRVVELIDKVSRCDVSLLIQGETGTGKELAARAIHYSGSRRDAPFVPINCGAIPDALVETELFGHVRGAFTDAREGHAGVVSQAEGGTLFLDEIEAMSVHAQVALLRFLQSLEYRPVGAAAPLRANVRIVAASNVDLSELARQGGYRSDLLFRLNVFVIEMPPLRARGDDVIDLAENFMDRFCSRYGKPHMTLSEDYRHHLRHYSWPGNVRELENTVHRKVFLCEGNVLRCDDPPGCFPSSEGLASPARGVTRFREAKAQAIAEFERAYLAELLKRTAGNVSHAARMCGQERSRLNKLIRKHGL